MSPAMSSAATRSVLAISASSAHTDSVPGMKRSYDDAISQDSSPMKAATADDQQQQATIGSDSSTSTTTSSLNMTAQHERCGAGGSAKRARTLMLDDDHTTTGTSTSANNTNSMFNHPTPSPAGTDDSGLGGSCAGSTTMDESSHLSSLSPTSTPTTSAAATTFDNVHHIADNNVPPSQLCAQTQVLNWLDPPPSTSTQSDDTEENNNNCIVFDKNTTDTNVPPKIVLSEPSTSAVVPTTSSTVSSSRPTPSTVQCLWTRCTHVATNHDLLATHLVQAHIEPLQPMGRIAKRPSSPLKSYHNTKYVCQWINSKTGLPCGKNKRMGTQEDQWNWLRGHVTSRHAHNRVHRCMLDGCELWLSTPAALAAHVNNTHPHANTGNTRKTGNGNNGVSANGTAAASRTNTNGTTQRRKAKYKPEPVFIRKPQIWIDSMDQATVNFMTALLYQDDAL